MGASAIEWTERTWNPVVGCSVHSAGCTNCYAMKMAGRLEAMASAHGSRFDGDPGPTGHYLGTTQRSKAGFVWTGQVNVAPDSVFLEPLKRKKSTIWFVNSMSDLFHDSVPDDVIDRVFAVMALCPQHRFQVLTKRSERMRAWVTRLEAAVLAWFVRCDPNQLHELPHMAAAIAHPAGPRAWPLSNVWLGVSVEDQRAADERIPDLLATPAAVRFLSCEPLLGPVHVGSIVVTDEDGDELHLRPLHGDHALVEGFEGPLVPVSADFMGKVDWVIVGGESGPGARPMHPDWVRGLRDQCAAAGVPFFFKQWGEWAPDHGPERVEGKRIVTDRVMEGRVACAMLVDGVWQHFPDGYAVPIELCVAGGREVYRYGKKAAGRLLDGLQHDGMPL